MTLYRYFSVYLLYRIIPLSSATPLYLNTRKDAHVSFDPTILKAITVPSKPLTDRMISIKP